MVFGHRDLFRDEQEAAPSVLDAAYTEENEDEDEDEPADEELESPPRLAYVPSGPVEPPQESVTVRLWPTNLGLTLLVFTSPELLASCLGGEQPWVGLPVEEVEGVGQTCGADAVRWDLVAPQEANSPEQRE